MPSDSAEMVSALATIRDTEAVVPLRLATMRALSICGIEKAYFIAPLTSDPRVKALLTNIGLPRVWERHYRARLYQLDPLPQLSLRYSNAFAWPHDLDLAKLTEKQRRYMHIAVQYGLERGIGTACYGPHGRAGFLGTVWPKTDRPPDRVLLAVHQIGQVSFQRYCGIIRQDIDIPPLSNRELEVLGWMCRGKSNPAMAEILGVSRSSIDAYIRRIFAKLGVTDRTAACVRGYTLGLVAGEELERMVALAQARDENRPVP